MDQSSPEVAFGVVVRMLGKRVIVRLENGEEVSCHFGRNDPFGLNVVGTRVEIQFRPVRKDKPPRVIKWIHK